MHILHAFWAVPNSCKTTHRHSLSRYLVRKVQRFVHALLAHVRIHCTRRVFLGHVARAHVVPLVVETELHAPETKLALLHRPALEDLVGLRVLLLLPTHSVVLADPVATLDRLLDAVLARPLPTRRRVVLLEVRLVALALIFLACAMSDAWPLSTSFCQEAALALRAATTFASSTFDASPLSMIFCHRPAIACLAATTFASSSVAALPVSISFCHRASMPRRDFLVSPGSAASLTTGVLLPPRDLVPAGSLASMTTGLLRKGMHSSAVAHAAAGSLIRSVDLLAPLEFLYF